MESAGSADSAAQPYRFNAKEDQSFTGVPLLDYGARFYNPTIARWTTLDPLAEKYYSVSPYAFCNNNPVRFIDFDGMAIYHINSSGVITFSEENTEIHRLYLLNEDGSRSDKYITLSNSDAMSALQQKDPDNKNEISSYTSDSNINDMFNIFLFAADNTTVEWALHRGQDNSYTIGTSHSDSEVSAYSVLRGTDEMPIASVHSHPDTRDLTTMGYCSETYYKSDQWKVVNGQSPEYNYVYFSKMNHLYLVGRYNPAFIRSINNYKNFYFGTLNSK